MKKDKDGEWILQTELPVLFAIKKTKDIFDPDNKDMLSFGSSGPGSRRLIVIDLKVSKYYLKRLDNYLEKNKIEHHIVIIDGTETNKNIETLLYLLNEIESFGMPRKSEPIIVIGGGVLLDLVGLAANLYRRGVPYIKIPTTLLAIVDASIGVKTAVNFEDRRNRLGTYYPPVAAYLDLNFLKTLEPVEVSSGLGEILKMAVVKDFRLFEILKEHGKELYERKFMDCEHADEVILRAVVGMKVELQDNLWEKNLKRYVDFGHSFSPIPEMRSLVDNKVDTLTHGQAVGLDVIFSCLISYNRNMLVEQDVNDVFCAAKDMSLPTYHPYFSNPNILVEALNDTVKHRNGDQNLPIPRTIGDSVFVNDLSYNEIKKAAVLMLEFNEKLRNK